MSANVTGGPTHWRANLDELGLGAARLREATEQTMRLAGDAAAAGGMAAQPPCRRASHGADPGGSDN